MKKIINVKPGSATTVGLVPTMTTYPVGYDMRAAVSTNQFVNVVNAQNKSYLELLLNPVEPRSLFPDNYDPLNSVPSIEFSFNLFPNTPGWFEHEIIIYDEDLNVVLFKGNVIESGEWTALQDALGGLDLLTKATVDSGVVNIRIYNTQEENRIISVFVHGVTFGGTAEHPLPEDYERILSLYDAGFNLVPTQTNITDSTKVESLVHAFSKGNLLVIDFKSSASIIPYGRPFHKAVFHAPPIDFLVNDVVIEVSKLNDTPLSFQTDYGNFTITSILSDSLNVVLPGEENVLKPFPEEYEGKGYRQITVICETGFVEVTASQGAGDSVDPILTLPTDVIPFDYTQLFNAYAGDSIIKYNEIQNQVCFLSTFSCRLTPDYVLDAAFGATDFVDVYFKSGTKWWIRAYDMVLTPKPIEATLDSFMKVLGPGGLIIDSPPSTDPDWVRIGFKLDPNAPAPNPGRPNYLALIFIEETGNTAPNVKDYQIPNQCELIGNKLQLALLQLKNGSGDCTPNNISFGNNEALPTGTTNIHMTVSVDGVEVVCKTTYQAGDTPDTAFERLIKDNTMAEIAIQQQFIKRTPENGGGIETYYQGVSVASGLGIGKQPVEILFRRNQVADSYDLYNTLMTSVDPEFTAHSCSWAVKGALSNAFTGGDENYAIGSYNEGRSVNRAYDPSGPQYFSYNPLVTPYLSTAPIISGGSQVSGMYQYYVNGTPENTPVNKGGMEAKIYMRNPMGSFDLISIAPESTSDTLYIDKVAVSYNAMAMRAKGADANAYIVTSRGNVVHGLISTGMLNLIDYVGPTEKAVSVSVNSYGTVAVVGTLVEPTDAKLGVTYSVYDIDQTTNSFKSDVYTVSGEWTDPEVDNTVTSEIFWIDKDNFTYSTKTGIVLGTINVTAKTVVGKFLVNPTDYKTQELELGNLMLFNFGNTFVVRANDKDHQGVNDSRLALGTLDRDTMTLTLNTDFGLMYRAAVLVEDNYRQFTKLGNNYILQLGVNGPNWFNPLTIENGVIVPGPSDLIISEVGPGPVPIDPPVGS